MRLPMIAIGYNTPGTGLTRVMHELLRPLSEHFDIHFLGIGCSAPYKDDGIKWYPTNEHGGDVFGQFQAEQLILSVKPKIVFIVHDLWLFEQYMRCFKPYRKTTKLVAYIPIDGNITDHRLVESLYAAHAVVAYTSWAQNQFENAFSRLTNDSHHAPPVYSVEHATDITQFRPTIELLNSGFHHSGRTEARQSLFPDLPDSAFIILNAARPSPRKRIDLTLNGFAQFAQGKADVFLCLHHAYTNEQSIQEVESLSAQLGIEQQILFNPLNPDGGPITDECLNQLYCACDVGLNTSMGEGWGLVSFEHAAAGAAQIVPGHSACRELWQGNGIVLEPDRYFIPDFSPLELAEVSAAAVSEALTSLYQDREYLQTMSAAAYQYASEKATFRWRDAAKKFEQLFLQLSEVKAT